MTHKPNPETWLRELGATRPMQPTRHVSLVIGEYDRSSSSYAVEYNSAAETKWRLFGHALKYDLTEHDVKGILRRLTSNG